MWTVTPIAGAIDSNLSPVGVVDTLTYGTSTSTQFTVCGDDIGFTALEAQAKLGSESTSTGARLDASTPTLAEPGKLGLIGVGLLCIAALVRRRRRP